MKPLLKSLAIALVATGLFFSLLMVLVVPVMAMMSSRNSAAVEHAVVNPNPFLRQVGLPMSGLVFLTAFGMSLRQAARRKAKS